jgi:hypothetical protein
MFSCDDLGESSTDDISSVDDCLSSGIMTLKCVDDIVLQFVGFVQMNAQGQMPTRFTIHVLCS